MQKRTYPKIRVISRLSSFLTGSVLLKIFKKTMQPIFDYGCSVSMECSNSMRDSLERLQNQVMRTILKANRISCTQSMRSKLGLLTLKNRRRFLRFQLVYKTINDYNCPNQLKGYLPQRSRLHGRDLRDNITQTFAKSNYNSWTKNVSICSSEGLERFTKIDKINYNLFIIQSSLI